MKIFVFLFLLLWPSNLNANDFKGAPQAPWLVPSNLFYLFLSNDGFGYDIGSESDDFRTFGLNLGIFTDYHAFFKAEVNSLTNRDTTDATSTRVDELELLAGYSFFEAEQSLFYMRIACGPGLLMFGNLGTGFLQSLFHDTFHMSDPRPLPLVYDPMQANFIAFLALDAGENILRMFHTRAFARVTNNFDYDLDLTLGSLIAKRLVQIDLSATYVFSRFESYPPAARATYSAEDGLWLSSTFTAGPVYIERAVNIFSTDPAGSIGMRLGNKNPDTANTGLRVDYSLGGVFGFISNVEILRIHPLDFFERLSAYSWVQKHEDFDTYMKMFRLHIQTIGIDISLFEPGEMTFVNPFGYIGIGFVNEREVTNDKFHARILDQRNLLVMHFGLGGRLKFSDFIRLGDFEYGMEFTWDLRFSYMGESIYSNAKSTARYGIYISEK